MKPKIGQYVRALHDFDTHEKGEITLRAGDVIKVIDVIDDNWLCGQLDCLQGNFPSNFVENVSLPDLKPGEKIFVAIDEFLAEQAGDLALNTGDIILGIKELDENWWQGKSGSKTGIFPLTCIRELFLDAQPRRKSFRSNTQTSCTSEPSSPTIHISEPLQARAVVDVTPQIDGELGFRRGDLITIKEVIDSDWLLGQCGNKEGLVSSVCVDILEKSSNNTVVNAGHSSLKNGHIGAVPPSVLHGNSDSLSRSRSLSYTSENTRSHDAEVTPYAQTLYPFVGQNEDELSFAEHDIVTLIQHVDPDWIEGEADGKIGLFPAAYVEIIVDCPYAYNTDETINASSADISEQSVNKGTTNSKLDDGNKVFYESSSSSSSSSSTAAAIITSTKICDNNKPSKPHVDKPIVLDPPSAVCSTDVDSNSNRLSFCSVASDVISLTGSASSGQEKFGLVLHNFDSQVEGDLSVQEGDTVTILQTLDDNWIKAQDDHGSIGIVPLNHIEVIGEGPTHALNEKLDFSIASRPGESKRVISSETTVHVSEVKDNSQNHRVVNSICDSSNITSSIAHHTVQTGTKHHVGEKPKLKPKPSIKPKLAPKPVIKSKPHVFAAQPFIKSTDVSSGLHIGHVVSPTERKTFFNINTSKSLNSLIEDQLEIAKVEASEVRARRLSIKSNDSSGSRGSDFSGKDGTTYGMSDTCGEPTVLSENKQSLDSNINQNKDVGSESLADANSGLVNAADTSVSLGKSNWVSFDTEETATKTSIRLANTTQPVADRGSNTLTSNTGIHRNSSFVNDGYEQDHIHEPKLVDVNAKYHNAPVLRPPPPVPVLRSNLTQEACKEPVKMPPARKAPPPRPTGPKIASAPSKIVLQPVKVNHPLPQRPAPPVPKISVKIPAPSAPPRPSSCSPPRRPQPRHVNRTLSNDLMSFSPEKEDIEEDANIEIIADVKKRIEEVQHDLQQYEKSCTELQSKLSLASQDDKQELQENLEDCNANVLGLTEELVRLKETLYQLSPVEEKKALAEKMRQKKVEEEKKQREEEKKQMEEMKKKRREKRIKVIQELINTEKDFLHDLHLCLETFLGQSAEKAPHLDMEMVMGNMEEIADVSQRLLTILEGSVNGKSFEEQIIGTHFVCFAEDMKNTYAPYCRNHDEVIALLEKYDGDTEVRDFFNKKIMEMREHTNVFDVKAMLIKPVQRILKYPLLLNELIKATEDDHPDKMEINEAICAMTCVATAINEYKRRKDLVFKYKKDTDQTFSDKISKLNLHSLKKKSSRIRGRLSTNLGISLVNRDENFEREEVKFRHLEKAIRVHLKNIITYMEQFQESVGSQEGFVADIIDLYDGQLSVEITKYRAVQNKIVTVLFEEMKNMVDELVIAPLNRLIGLCVGPNNVIEKRFDKLLDYESQLRKAKDNEKNDALNKTKNDYEAMNAQLLDELPKFYALAYKLLTDCSGVFVKAQKIFMDKALKETCILMQLPLLLGTDDSIMDKFNVKHTAELDKVSMLSFIPRGFNPKMDTMNKMDKKQKRMSWDTTVTKPNMAAPTTPQSDSQRVYLRQLYTADKLFRVSTTYKATDLMDISLNEGHMVGLIKDQDPMGNKEKWFVDDGVAKGFFPKRVLVPWTVENISPAGSLNSLVLGDRLDGLVTSSAIGDAASDTASTSSLEQAMFPQLPVTPEPEPVQQNEYYCAEFAFQARSENEVSLFEGQVVTVLSKSDLEGNSEWWYVDADGHTGYTPSAYLRIM